MPSILERVLPALNLRLTRARAKVLAREDRELRAALVRLRRESGMTQQQVADLVGVSQQAIHKLERYDADPKQSTLRQYANAVGALVEHRVTRDIGQSVWIASSTRWESNVEIQPASLHAEFAPVEKNLAGAGWVNSKRTDFALVG
ncbi:helix-turn-helix domain-containing protein [Curtobacterium flaccumfaciens pv. oortii]|uniref:helix-turn-helix domain-containing protein n=1 Tax=Curtobacterium TaxID=2034 RepID=UPI001BDEA6EC|nr:MULTISPECIES: helix-turn-helix transcriptional regulator [Curtobacterium]MBT1621181.1 helix-turn-helix domain-containing protein [Curtobacterium flaccumfaciens pv. oortii]